MDWIDAQEYSARVGGILYRNVLHPITVNGQPLITLERDTATRELAVSFEIISQEGQKIASVRRNSLALHDATHFVAVFAPSRFAVIERNSGRVWCDLRFATGPYAPAYELDCACLLFSDSGYPVILHPDRTRLGQVNEGACPTVARITLSTAPGSEATAIALDNASLYLLAVSIENFRTGIAVTHTVTHDD